MRHHGFCSCDTRLQSLCVTRCYITVYFVHKLRTVKLVGQRHFRGASNSERVPLLAVVNDRPDELARPQPQAVLRAHTPRGTAWSYGRRVHMETSLNSKQWHTDFGSRIRQNVGAAV